MRSRNFNTFETSIEDAQSSPSSASSSSSTLTTQGQLFGLDENEHVQGWTSARSDRQIETALAAYKTPSSATTARSIDASMKSAIATSSRSKHEREDASLSPTLERAKAKRRRRSQVAAHQADGSERAKSPEATAYRRTSYHSPESATASREPKRPQSAMKHRSANHYSSGRDTPLIRVSSSSLSCMKSTENEDDMADDVDAAVFGSCRPSQMRSGGAFRSRRSASSTGNNKDGKGLQAQITASPESIQSQDDDVLSPTEFVGSQAAQRHSKKPLGGKARTASTSRRSALSTTMSSPGPSSRSFVLHSRSSLPKTDFYARTKEEERSPTPVRRKNIAM